MAKDYMSAGVGFTEREIRPEVTSPESLSYGVIGGAKKGPLELTLITSTNQLKSVFGTSASTDFGVWAAKKILGNSNRVYFQRVVGEDAAKGTTPTTITVTTGEGDEAVTETVAVPVVFTTKEYDSTLEGAVINLTVVDGVVAYTATLGNTVLETLTGLGLDDTKANYLITVINKKSKYFDVAITEGEALADYTGGTYTISGCDDGIDSLTAEDVAAAFDAFSSSEMVDVSTVIAPGWSDVEVISAGKELVNYRGDVMYIPDCPKGLTPEQFKEWANSIGDFQDNVNLDNEQFATYYPWVYDEDEATGETILTPPSGWAAAQFAYTDNVVGAWFAPAGVQGNNPRGLLQGARGLEHYLTKEERDMVYSECRANPIVKFYGRGIVLWGNKTMKKVESFETPSALSSINVRRLCNYIRKFVTDISLTEVFNPNDSATWNSWKLKINPRLRAIQENRGISEYQIKMDASTVTETDIVEGRMPGQIYIKPVRAVEWIPITFVVTSDSVEFSEGA